MPQIGSLAYKLTMDHSDFKRGAISTRRELSQAKRLFGETRTTTEKLGFAQKELGRLFKKGAIDTDTYRRAMKS